MLGWDSAGAAAAGVLGVVLGACLLRRFGVLLLLGRLGVLLSACLRRTEHERQPPAVWKRTRWLWSCPPPHPPLQTLKQLIVLHAACMHFTRHTIAPQQRLAITD